MDTLKTGVGNFKAEVTTRFDKLAAKFDGAD